MIYISLLIKTNTQACQNQFKFIPNFSQNYQKKKMIMWWIKEIRLAPKTSSIYHRIKRCASSTSSVNNPILRWFDSTNSYKSNW